MTVYLIRVKGLTESPRSWGKVPFETTFKKEIRGDFIDSYDFIKQEYEQKGFDVLWIYEHIRRIGI